TTTPTTTTTDTQSIAEAPPSPTHVASRREDYRAPDWLVPEIRLDFDLDPERTRVRATLLVERSEDAEFRAPLRLNGGGQVPLYVRSRGDDETVWRMDGSDLVIEDLPLDCHT